MASGKTLIFCVDYLYINSSITGKDDYHFNAAIMYLVSSWEIEYQSLEPIIYFHIQKCFKRNLSFPKLIHLNITDETRISDIFIVCKYHTVHVSLYDDSVEVERYSLE